MANFPARVGVVTSILIALGGGAVCAADMPVKATPLVPGSYNWSGIYVGVHAGYGKGMKDWPSMNPLLDYDVKGFLGGGQVGVNQQIGNWVIGIEVDASWADIKGSQAHFLGSVVGVGTTTSTAIATTRIDRLVTVAGRLGFAQARWLVYVKAGAVWAHENHTLATQATLGIVGGPTLTSSMALAGSENRFGPTLGFGAEYALWGNWSFKSEYNYLHLLTGTVRLAGSQTSFGVTGPFTIDANIQQAFHLVKLGLNYRFGWEPSRPFAPAQPAPGYNWTGFYVGAQAAYGLGRKEWELGPDARFDVGGALAGGVTGTNVQAGAFVFGVESEWMWSGVKGSTRFSPPLLAGVTQSTDLATRMDWLSLSSVRAGFVAADRWLVYLKGGVALAQETHAVTLSAAFPFGSFTTPANGTALHTGYLAGVGMEYAFLGNWSAKLEYNFIDFRPQNVRGVGFQTATGIFVPTGIVQRNTIDQHLHLVKLGVNYHFSPLADVVSAKY